MRKLKRLIRGVIDLVKMIFGSRGSGGWCLMLLLLLPSPALALKIDLDSPPSLPRIALGYAATGGYDWAATNWCENLGKCRELNPIMSDRLARGWVKGSVFVAVTTISYFGEKHTSGWKRKTLRLLRYGYWGTRVVAGGVATYHALR